MALLTARTYNLILLSLAFMLVFTAFNTAGNLQKVVLDSIKDFDGDAYVSQAIIYTCFAVFNWLAPSIISVVGPRITMFVSALGYLGFVVSFLYPLGWLLYLMSAILGCCAGLLWAAQGNYMSLNAGTRNITTHSGVFWAVSQCSLLIGNTFVYIVFFGKTEITDGIRHLVYSVLSAIGGVGVILFLFLRAPCISDDSSVDVNPNHGPIKAFKGAVKLFFTPVMLLFCLSFFYTGFVLSFYAAVYGSAIGSTLRLKEAKELVGLSGIFIGLGEIIGGLTFGIFGRKTVKYGRGPVIFTGFLIHVVCFVLIFLNLPDQSPIGPTHDAAYIKTSPIIAMACSFLLGLGDSLFNTQIYASLGTVYANDSAPAFAIYKCIQSVASAIAFYYSSYVGLYTQIYIMGTFAVIGTASFITAEIWAKRLR